MFYKTSLTFSSLNIINRLSKWICENNHTALYARMPHSKKDTMRVVTVKSDN